MIRFASIAALALAVLAEVAPAALAQNVPSTNPQDASPAAAPVAAAPVAGEAPTANRIIGIATNREMIAAEAPTEIVINGTAVDHCGLVVDFGDGTRSGNVVSASSPFPLRMSHTYPRADDVVVRVNGADEGTAPPCLGAAEAAVHVSPAGSKIEYITLSTGCPEGWQLKGAVNADKSFMCAPIPDASAPTNLIHCIDGMKYFARDGHVGCMHPLAPAPEKFAKASSPKGKAKAPVKAAKATANAGASAAPKARSSGASPRTAVKPTTPPRAKGPGAPN